MRRFKIMLIRRALYWCVDALRRQGVAAGAYLTTLGNEVIMIEKGGDE